MVEEHKDRMIAVSAFIPNKALPITLNPLAASVSIYMADSLDDNYERACQYNYASNRLCNLGYIQEALERSMMSVSLFREIDFNNIFGGKRSYGVSLFNYSNRLSSVGRKAEAESAARESSDIFSELLETDNISSCNDYFAGAINFAEKLLAVGDVKSSRKSIIMARSFLRSRHKVDYRAYNSLCVKFFSVYSKVMMASNRMYSCVIAQRRALEIQRRLVSENMQENEPRLATVLLDYASALLSNGRSKEAHEIIVESIMIFERLAESHPMGFNESLAISIAVLSECFWDHGMSQEAIEALKEAIEIIEPFFNSNPCGNAGENYRKMKQRLAVWQS